MTILDLDRKVSAIKKLVLEARDHPDDVSFDNTLEWKQAATLVDELNFHFEAIGANLRIQWSTSYSQYILLHD